LNYNLDFIIKLEELKLLTDEQRIELKLKIIPDFAKLINSMQKGSSFSKLELSTFTESIDFFIKNLTAHIEYLNIFEIIKILTKSQFTVINTNYGAYKNTPYTDSDTDSDTNSDAESDAEYYDAFDILKETKDSLNIIISLIRSSFLTKDELTYFMTNTIPTLKKLIYFFIHHFIDDPSKDLVQKLSIESSEIDTHDYHISHDLNLHELDDYVDYYYLFIENINTFTDNLSFYKNIKE
jgi:hypothetical protein